MADIGTIKEVTTAPLYVPKRTPLTLPEWLDPNVAPAPVRERELVPAKGK